MLLQTWILLLAIHHQIHQTLKSSRTCKAIHQLTNKPINQITNQPTNQNRRPHQTWLWTRETSGWEKSFGLATGAGTLKWAKLTVTAQTVTVSIRNATIVLKRKNWFAIRLVKHECSPLCSDWHYPKNYISRRSTHHHNSSSTRHHASHHHSGSSRR